MVELKDGVTLNISRIRMNKTEIIVIDTVPLVGRPFQANVSPVDLTLDKLKKYCRASIREAKVNEHVATVAQSY